MSNETYPVDRRGANEHATPQSDGAVGFSRRPSLEQDLTPDLTATVAEAFAKATPLMIKGSGRKTLYCRCP